MHGCALVIRASGHDVIPRREPAGFYTGEFWACHSKSEREAIGRARLEPPGALTALLSRWSMRCGATVDGVGHGGEGDADTAGVLQDQGEGVGGEGWFQSRFRFEPRFSVDEIPGDRAARPRVSRTREDCQGTPGGRYGASAYTPLEYDVRG